MLETLILCMALDYLTGMMAAGIFHKSKKSAQGGLESRSGWKGLCRKGISLLIVLVAYRLDLIAGTDFICNAVMAAYLVNELLSITENLGLMGVPVPKVLTSAIDLLNRRVKHRKQTRCREPKGNLSKQGKKNRNIRKENIKKERKKNYEWSK